VTALIRLARYLAGLVRVAAGLPCDCPACDRIEQYARAALGMPASHPERITRDLPRAQERGLAVLAAELWPGGEYTQIIDAWQDGGSP
jgi:hypothetical protein